GSPATGSPATSSSAGASSSSASSGPAVASSPEALAGMLQQGLAATRSAHIGLRITSGGAAITGSGRETLAGGKLTALDLTETIPNVGDLRLIQAAGKTYAKLPAKLNSSGKPFIL